MSHFLYAKPKILRQNTRKTGSTSRFVVESLKVKVKLLQRQLGVDVECLSVNGHFTLSGENNHTPWILCVIIVPTQPSITLHFFSMLNRCLVEKLAFENCTEFQNTASYSPSCNSKLHSIICDAVQNLNVNGLILNVQI